MEHEHSAVPRPEPPQPQPARRESFWPEPPQPEPSQPEQPQPEPPWPGAIAGEPPSAGPPAAGPAPAQPPLSRPQRRTRQARARGWRHYLLLPLAGLICCAALTVLATLAWGSLIYSQKGYIDSAGLLPLYIFLAAIFLSSCLVTALSRGGAIFPALLFALLANIVSWQLAELSAPKLSGMLIKLLLSLLSAVIGFTLIKLLIVRRRR